MSNEADINKKSVNSLFHLELVAKIRKLAKSLNITVTDLMEIILIKELNKRVVLDDTDYLWIADEVRKNKEKRILKRSGKTLRKTNKV